MSDPASEPPADTGERLVCAVLSAQVAALRECMQTASTVETLWRASDALSQVVAQANIDQANIDQAGIDQAAASSAAALAAVADVSRRLEALAFTQAQSQDCLSQMAECLVTALHRLATADAPAGTRLPPADLVALYICEDQHRVHEEASRLFQAERDAP